MDFLRSFFSIYTGPYHFLSQMSFSTLTQNIVLDSAWAKNEENNPNPVILHLKKLQNIPNPVQ